MKSLSRRKFSFSLEFPLCDDFERACKVVGISPSKLSADMARDFTMRVGNTIQKLQEDLDKNKEESVAA